MESEISKIFIHELFIYTIAYFLKQKMYSDIGYILGRTYFRDVPHYGFLLSWSILYRYQ